MYIEMRSGKILAEIYLDHAAAGIKLLAESIRNMYVILNKKRKWGKL